MVSRILRDSVAKSDVASSLRFFLRALVVAVLNAAVHGATITVVSNADSGAGTLRQAIFDASSGDTINFAIKYPTTFFQPREIRLSSELLINKNLTIQGPPPGPEHLTVRVADHPPNFFRVFRIASASVTATIAGLTVSGGDPSSGIVGGGIANAGTLTLDSCTLTGNRTTTDGGGISNTGVLTVRNSTLDNNVCIIASTNSGAGIFNAGTLTVSNSTISGNFFFGPNGSQTWNGAGIANASGATLLVAHSTIAGNSISGTPNAFGGGIYVAPGSSATVRSSIIATNTARFGPDIYGTVTSQNYNLIGNNSDATIVTPQSSDQVGTSSAPIDPLIGLRQDNGGPTFTHAIQSTSPAVDHGDPNSPPRDQRGYLRAGVPDIGAFEFHGTVPVSLANLSARLPVQTGDNVLFAGFIVTGAAPKKILIRALGPSLNLPGELANPILELRDGNGGLIAVNDNWRSDQESEISASGAPPPNDLESAIVATVPANNSTYTAIMRGVNGGTGTGVVEIYDLDRTVDSKLVNISARGFVQIDDNVLIGGFIVFGQDPVKVIVRAIGPSLGLPNELADPTLELRDGNGGLLMQNDNWRSDQEAEIIATTIPPSNDLESAIVRTLTPGNYTAIVRGANKGTGIGLVEVYGLY